MSYIGSSAAVTPVAFSGVNAQSFNGDGSTVAFTLNRPVSSVAAIEVVVNNVQQSPYDGSYSVSNTTLTFSAAPSTGTGNIYVVYRDFPVGSITDPNTYTKTQTDTLLAGRVAKAGDTMTGRLVVTDTINTDSSYPLGIQNGSQQPWWLRAENTSNRFSIHLNGTGNIIEADSAGRVTMPYQPSFRVSKAGSAANQNSYVIFDTVYHNIGSHYSTSTGRFTAPIAGRYLFCVVNNMGASAQADTFLTINGSNAVGVEHDPATGGTAYWLGLSIPVVLNLNANDYVQVYINGTPTYGVEGIPWNSFSGQLIG